MACRGPCLQVNEDMGLNLDLLQSPSLSFIVELILEQALHTGLHGPMPSPSFPEVSGSAASYCLQAIMTLSSLCRALFAIRSELDRL